MWTADTTDIPKKANDEQTIKESSLALLEMQIGLRPSATLAVRSKASSFRYTTLYCRPQIDQMFFWTNEAQGAFSGCIVAFLFGEQWGRRLSMWVAMVFIVSPRKWV